MRPGGSTLNPYAEAYIPISKRESAPEDTHLNAFPQGGSQGQSEEHGQAPLSTQNQFLSPGFYGGSSQNVNEVAEEQSMSEQFDFALEYLKNSFPDFSEDSLSKAYLLNAGDLVATMDMLHELEQPEIRSSGSLPDSLDIGDVSESSLSLQRAPLRHISVPEADEGPSDSAGSS